jgi:hypothetical protein
LRLLAGHQGSDTPHDESEHCEKPESGQYGSERSTYRRTKFRKCHVVSLPSRTGVFEILREFFKIF